MSAGYYEAKLNEKTMLTEESIKKFYDLELAHTDYYHIDVMDGKFVENNTEEMMNEYSTQIKQISNIPLDVHLMVKDIKSYIEEYVPFLPNIITFHYEACENKEEVFKYINMIKNERIKVGLSIKPDTKVEDIYEFLPFIHMVLIMTVEPGKGGQALIPETLEKVKKLKQYINENDIEIDIEADGGINKETIKDVVDAGVDIAVVGNGIIKTEDYIKTIKELKEIN